MITLDKIEAVVYGHTIGDAVGVPVEFYSREELRENPVVEMEGYGTYPFPAGCWSDDSSMALCALESLSSGKLNYDDIMLNFGKWYYNDEFTPTGEMFDVGNTCSCAIENYHKLKKGFEKCGLKDEYSNGNGSLMRIYPFALFTYSKGMTLGDSLRIIHQASALTHAHPRSRIACGIYSMILWKLLENPSKETILKELENAYVLYDSGLSVTEEEYDHYKELENFDFACYAAIAKKTEKEIKSSGYVVDTLEAALWCVLTTEDYKSCVLKAVNLGDDTDTVAAVAGSLAGALYGIDGIPNEWKDKLQKNTYIKQLCLDFYNQMKK